jgi:hypothetical protein
VLSEEVEKRKKIQAAVCNIKRGEEEGRKTLVVFI